MALFPFYRCGSRGLYDLIKVETLLSLVVFGLP